MIVADMADELETCLAALYLNKGKDVLTVKEFAMYISLDLRWMQVKDAELLMRTLIKRGLMTRSGDYLKPAVDISAIDVPVAYRPSEELINGLRKVEPEPAEIPAATDTVDVLNDLIQKAIETGMEKGAFISECNKVRKRTNVDMEVAALMILRDKGVDVDPYLEPVRSAILSR